MTDHFFVYYQNALNRALSIDAAPLETGFDSADLRHPFRSRQVNFTAPTAHINIQWGANTFIAACALVDCLFHDARLVLKNSGETVLTADLYAQGGPVSLWRLDRLYQVTEMDLTVYAAQNLSIAYLYAGPYTAFPRFTSGPETGMELAALAGRTAKGQVYGLPMPPARTFSASFQRIDRRLKQDMETYIASVQTTLPHIIAPYNPWEYPALYAALTSAGKFSKRGENGFYFDTSMAWKEAY